ncbi:Hydrogen peroxide stress regulator 1 [Cyphellophora attinorum]|uniref:Hydrogen peroxide stress regulator 1 n=1 Tax=Cyphellophora attinorum TaxID=1664694 RepID=A0A0N1HB53_9EURO|nr:Hydrogen peroxide stress regulator 1 [Phialophora attinorum]KPI40262.1 Hydrogen peroxide stress regulator 1 [Phialophora attinorum]
MSNPISKSNAEAEIIHLKAQNQRLEDSLARLRAEYQQLSTQFEKLQKSNAEIAKASPNQLERAFRDLLEQNRAQFAAIEQSANERANLQHQVHQLQQQLVGPPPQQQQNPYGQPAHQAYDPRLVPATPAGHPPAAMPQSQPYPPQPYPPPQHPVNNGYAEAISTVPPPAVASSMSANEQSPGPSTPGSPGTKKRKRDRSSAIAPSANSAPSPTTAAYNPATQRWHCPSCAKDFSRRQHMQRHERSAHSDVKPHVCEICGAGYSRKDHLGEHSKRAHGVVPVAPPPRVGPLSGGEKGRGDDDLGSELERAVAAFG